MWRALEGPPRELFFPQEHHPGDRCASDFCHLPRLGVTLAGQSLPHLLDPFVRTYSNWETGMVCFSERFESVSAGRQRALWELGGGPKRHRSDSLSAAVRLPDRPDEFTGRYAALLDHYRLAGERIPVGKANQNGDVEPRHHRLRRALGQALMLRGSRDSGHREGDAAFLRRTFSQLPAGRRQRLGEEIPLLRSLPPGKVALRKKLRVTVGRTSSVRLDAEHLEVGYGQRCVQRLPRLHTEHGAHIDYRHSIDWLVRKPGAFANYREREPLFPSSRLHIAYDLRKATDPLHADQRYLKLLHLAATASETGGEQALRQLLDCGEPVTPDAVAALRKEGGPMVPATAVAVEPPALGAYDTLLTLKEVA